MRFQRQFAPAVRAEGRRTQPLEFDALSGLGIQGHHRRSRPGASSGFPGRRSRPFRAIASISRIGGIRGGGRELPEVLSEGETLDEAKANLLDALTQVMAY
jgi:hypothetical protein